MSRWEFMRQLEDLLSDIPPGEREEALQYYNDYFNDAGRANEQEVIKALGTPEQVAQIVKDGISGNGESGEFTENGFTSTASSGQNELMKRTGADSGTKEKDSGVQKDDNTSLEDNAFKNAGNGRQAGKLDGNGSTGNNNGSGRGGSFTGNSGNFTDTGWEKDNGRYAGSSSGNWNSDNSGGGTKAKQKDEMPVWAIVLIVIGCILFSPAIIGLLCGGLGLVVGIFAIVFGLVFGLGITTLVLFVVAVALVVAGFGCIWAHPVAGIGLLGGGLICIAFGILFMILTTLLTVKCIPGICKGIASIFRKLFGSKGGARQ